jgi:hypothetical protein
MRPTGGLMQLRVRLISIGLCIFLSVCLASPVARLLAQEYWYEFYRDGLTAWQKKDWERAEAKLKAALARRAEQGRAIPVPGRHIDYLPEYYLGLVQLKQQRFQEATDLLEKVQRDGLIDSNSAEFRDLQAALDESRRGNIASFKARTVKIEAVRSDDSRQIGTGIIVVRDAQGLQIVTALHVFMVNDGANAPPKSICVSFFEGDRCPGGGVPGEWYKFDSTLDLAVIGVKMPRRAPTVVKNWEYREGELEKDEKVLTVGHAVEDFGVTTTNYVVNPKDADSRLLVISGAGIGEKASGGPVIDSRGRLAGLMVDVDPKSSQVRAVQGTVLRHMLVDVWPTTAPAPLRPR